MSNIPPYQSHQSSQPPKRGMPGWGWALIILGIGGCACCPIGAAILLPVFSQARSAAISSETLSVTKQLALATVVYTTDHKDKFPNFGSPIDLAQELKPYMATKPATKMADYRWNSTLAEKNSMDLSNSAEVWICETGPDQRKRFSVGFADGHAKNVTPEQWESIQRVKPVFEKPTH